MRGTAANEAVVSQAATDAFRRGYAKAIGEKPIQRGKWVFDPRVMKLVRAEDYVPPHENHGLMVMSDRYMEGTISPVDGSDIGSRKKRRRHMLEHNLVDHDDYSPQWRANLHKQWEREADRERHEAMGRAIYEVTERNRRRK